MHLNFRNGVIHLVVRAEKFPIFDENNLINGRHVLPNNCIRFFPLIARKHFPLAMKMSNYSTLIKMVCKLDSTSTLEMKCVYIEFALVR